MIDAVKAVSNITLSVKFTRTAEMKARLWLASLFIRLGCMIGGIGYEEADSPELSPDSFYIGRE